MYHEKWKCEVISKRIRHPVYVVYGFACGWTVGEGLGGFDEVTKGHHLQEGWEVGEEY